MQGFISTEWMLFHPTRFIAEIEMTLKKIEMLNPTVKSLLQEYLGTLLFFCFAVFSPDVRE